MRSLLTNSRASCYAICPRKHHLSYNLGYRPVDKAFPLRFGEIEHFGLEAWWAESGSERLETGLRNIAEACDREQVDDFVRVQAEEILRGYHYRWCGTNDLYIRTIRIEHEFRIPLTNPATGARSVDWDLGGKIDKIAEIAGRGEFLVEHKTSSEDFGPGSDYQTRTTLSTQVSIYHRAGKVIGHDIKGCLYDVLRRPSMKPLKSAPEESRKYKKNGELYANQRLDDETPEEYRLRLRSDIADNPDKYYQRFTVVRLSNEEHEAALDTWHVAEMITESQRRDSHPRFVHSCKSYGSVCSFLGVCSGVSDLTDPTKFRKSDVVNEELGGDNDQENSIQETTANRSLRSAECRQINPS